MEQAIYKGLNDKLYERRKNAALDLEKVVRECHLQRDNLKINAIIEQLVDMFATPANPLHARNGGLIGLAATAIALNVEIAPFLERFIDPLLRCFSDPESRVRYFACESMYNIAKVSKGEILVYFNPIFDSLSKLASDVESSVKNGAELLDRLLKDIVAESAPIYFPQFPETALVRQATQFGHAFASAPGLDPHEKEPHGEHLDRLKAFSLAHFIPLLAERIYVISPFTRSYLVQWITVLDSVPDLELVSFLPEFLDGLFKYLSDPTEDVRVATEYIMSEFLREIRDISMLSKRNGGKSKRRRESSKSAARVPDDLPDITLDEPQSTTLTDSPKMKTEGSDETLPGAALEDEREEGGEVKYRSRERDEEEDLGTWQRGQDVVVDHAAIVEILLEQLDASHDEIQRLTALRWLNDFLEFAQDVMVRFTPRLIPALLPNIAHHVPAIQKYAGEGNDALFGIIESLPAPRSDPPAAQGGVTAHPTGSSTTSMRTGTGTGTTAPSSPPQPESQTLSFPRAGPGVGESNRSQLPIPKASRERTMGSTSAGEAAGTGNGDAGGGLSGLSLSRPQSPTLIGLGISALNKSTSGPANGSSIRPGPGAHDPALNFLSHSTSQPPALTNLLDASEEPPTIADEPPPPPDPFDYHSTVSGLLVQFLSEFVETRVAALKWLLMLHRKAPKKIMTMDGEDGTFPVLLQTLSDPSDDVIKYDLQLLAQISSSSEDRYFRAFMTNLLQLFSTDRRLLETRGSLIIRQLCLILNTERIFRTFSEILEKEEDLEFASFMVQRLNVILTTSPELNDFRKRLRNTDSRDGQALFTVLYRSWCHNPVAVFSLCLLAQAYEHASNLLPIVADLEITVQLLVQIDKLVQLIESPVFTSLRLQLLEPDKNHHLFKCLYGLLMLLPQSSAFLLLRNRLGAASSLGLLPAPPRNSAPQPSAIRSKLGRDESIKWQDLVSHFRTVQAKHEKARRGEVAASVLAPTGTSLPTNTASGSGSPNLNGNGAGASERVGRPQNRRRVTNSGAPGPGLTGAGGTGEGATSGSVSMSRPGIGSASSALNALSPLNPKSRAAPALAAAVGASGGLPARSMSPTGVARLKKSTLGGAGVTGAGGPLGKK